MEPDDSLLQMTPMGSWCIDAFSSMLEISRNTVGGNYQTVVHVLKFFCTLNKVFLQDSAVMLLLHPSRMEESPLFRSLWVFRSSLFTKYLFEMKKALDTAQDPLESRIDVVVPGLLKWHKNHQENFKKVQLGIGELKKEMESKIEALSNDDQRSNIPCTEDNDWYNMLVHLGRKLGAHMLDFLEEFKEDKQLMGQWSPDVVDNHYSTKLPMRPIRKLAGYTT